MKRLKLHLGCGKRFLPGFVHVDLADFPHVDYRSSVDHLDMFPSASAQLIYCSHVLEYFDRAQAITVLAEWRRVLCPGGTLRLAVPDFRALAEAYLASGAIEQILGPLYGRMEVAGAGQWIYHRTAYDFPSLERLLEACGFGAVARYDWRETIHRQVDDHSQAYLPHMDKEHGRLISLNVECRKTHSAAAKPTRIPKKGEAHARIQKNSAD